LDRVTTKLTLKPWFFNPSHPQPAPNDSFGDGCKFQIRAATPSDLAGVAQIIAESFHSQNGIWGWTFPLLRLGIYEDLRHRLASPAPHQVCLVVLETTAGAHSNVAGTVELGVRFSNSWTQVGRSFPYLSNLAVHPNYRRQRAASRLLEACEKVALSWGFQDIYLHVLENNHQARQLYFKQGYQVHRVEYNWNLFPFKRSRQIFLHKHLSRSGSI
jgi:ribosomal protein S18 acetylase RimI-like enzyme